VCGGPLSFGKMGVCGHHSAQVPWEEDCYSWPLQARCLYSSWVPLHMLRSFNSLPRSVCTLLPLLLHPLWGPLSSGPFFPPGWFTISTPPTSTILKSRYCCYPTPPSAGSQRPKITAPKDWISVAHQLGQTMAAAPDANQFTWELFLVYITITMVLF